MEEFAIGIDTSNYKTSVAVVDRRDHITADERILLSVPEGKRGLRQQEALFQHVENLPVLLEKVLPICREGKVSVVAVSSRPRPVEGSYMPVFLAGLGQARALAAAYGCPCISFAHQEGHIEAVRRYTELKDADRFCAFHFSGGTTEALLYEDGKLTNVGGSLDISFGQLLDRAGVALHAPFPAGDVLDKLAAPRLEKGRPAGLADLPKIRCRDGEINLSGIETKVLREIEKGGYASPEEAAQLITALFYRIGEAMSDIVRDIAAEHDIKDFLFSGGVSASTALRALVRRMLPKDYQIVYGDPALSSDNAVGIALLGGNTQWR